MLWHVLVCSKTGLGPAIVIVVLYAGIILCMCPWQTILKCNVASYWLDTYTKWSQFMQYYVIWDHFINGPILLLSHYQHLPLTHCRRVTHICVNKLTITGSDNGLSPDRRQAIIWTNAGILLIRTLGTNFSEIESEIGAFLSKEMDLKMSSGKWRPFCLGLNVLTWYQHHQRDAATITAITNPTMHKTNVPQCTVM